MLEAKLSVHYGKHNALDRAKISVSAGETVVVLGANGAGKSTLLKALGGMIAPDKGSVVRFDGQDITGLNAHEHVGHGIALVPEGRGVFGEMSVAENLLLGAYPKHARTAEAALKSEVFSLFPRLGERAHQIVRTMSGGEQQMVAIGRALMSQPRLLMLDEPSLGLAPRLVGEMFGVLEKIKQTGLALLIVEQNVKASLGIANRGYLLESGRIVGHGTAAELKGDPAVQRAFLGAKQEA